MPRQWPACCYSIGYAIALVLILHGGGVTTVGLSPRVAGGVMIAGVPPQL